MLVGVSIVGVAIIAVYVCVVGLDSAKRALQEIVVYPALNPQVPAQCVYQLCVCTSVQGYINNYWSLALLPW